MSLLIFTQGVTAFFGKHIIVELSGDKPQWFWIPAGFAHGFLVLSKDGADLSYKVDAHWNSRGEGSIFWKDLELAIPWPSMSPLLSEKDQKGSFLQNTNFNLSFKTIKCRILFTAHHLTSLLNL